ARVAALDRMADGVVAWGECAVALEDRRAALLLSGAARLALAAVPAGLHGLRQALAALPARLAAGQDPVPEITALAERPDWILDGWDMLAALWAASPPAEHGMALHDALAQLPVPPLEAETWPGPAADWDTLLRGRRLVAPRPAWARQGRGLLIARNEQLLGIAA
ncbi:hypothetical protein, partial [Falsiroseomonas sp. CW058]|uniref:hypothetical protein n=1 Tax=Falsiroseomonas sp. CW058 TaxID=3388664 RepID=UPI003D31F7BE